MGCQDHQEGWEQGKGQSLHPLVQADLPVHQSILRVPAMLCQHADALNIHQQESAGARKPSSLLLSTSTALSHGLPSAACREIAASGDGQRRAAAREVHRRLSAQRSHGHSSCRGESALLGALRGHRSLQLAAPRLVTCVSWCPEAFTRGLRLCFHWAFPGDRSICFFLIFCISAAQRRKAGGAVQSQSLAVTLPREDNVVPS